MSDKSIGLKTIKQQHYPKELTKEEEQNLKLMFSESQLQNYFDAMQSNSKTPQQIIQLAGLMYGDQRIRKVTFDIKKGNTKVLDSQQNIDNFLVRQKIKQQQSKAQELRLKKEQIIRQLQYLDAQTSITGKRTNPQLLNDDIKPPNVLSKNQHQNIVQEIMKSREQLDKKHERNINNLEKSLQKKRQQQRKAKQDKINRQIAKRCKKIQKRSEQKKIQHEKFIQFEKQSQRKFQEMRKKKFLHQQIQQKYNNQVVIPALQAKKKKLKEIRQLSKQFNVNELIEHQKQYLEKRNQSLSMVRSKVNQDWHYRPPQKTQKLSRFLEQQKTEQRKKLQQNKRKIDQKISRQQNFVNYLKQKFAPVVSQKKQKQIQMRIQRDKNKRRQSGTDSKILGMSYLQEAKRLATHKTIDRPETQKNITQRSQQTCTKSQQYTNYLSTISHDKQYYEAKRRKRLEKLINSEQTETQKIKKLKIQTQKINEKMHRRKQLKKLKNKSYQMTKDEDQDIQLLLSGIQAKMGIIEVFKNNHQ